MPTRKSRSRPRVPKVRKGQPDVSLSHAEFMSRVANRFYDPLFDDAQPEIDRIAARAWQSYSNSHKSPRQRRAGKGFAAPEYELPEEWLEARAKIQAAKARHANAKSPNRVLLICASARSDQSCPGEMSKTYRLVRIAHEVFESQRGFEVDLLDLSRLTSEYGRVIYPCKGCVSTAMPLCHWPCSCYPNHALGQVNDWMNELYPRWVSAHGVMIVTPVYWYQAPSVLKLMIDRLVCADGGNPDPTSTRGKDPKRAKALELAGWSYPRHLAGRAFAVVVHGDAAGASTLRRSLVDWLTDMHLISAGGAATFDRYLGYYEPYATSHDALDDDEALQQEVRNAARALVRKVSEVRKSRPVDKQFVDPRPK